MKPRFTRYEKKQNRETNLKKNMAGTGLYVYENNSDGELTLPRATASGVRKVAGRGRFQGDDYYMQYVKMNLLRFIEQLQPNDKEKTQMEKKLILDQPETVTNRGTVEHVVQDQSVPVQSLNDNTQVVPAKEVLLTEDPMDGVEIILG